MKWFGKAYGAPYESDGPRVPTPVGALCSWCDEPIEPGDDGIMSTFIDEVSIAVEEPTHYECHLRTIVGGLNHQLGRCTCCGGTLPPDPPEMRRHEAAIAATTHWLMARPAREMGDVPSTDK